MTADIGVAILGCGLIGNKRARALGEAKLLACADSDLGRAQRLAAGAPGCIATADWRAVLTMPAVSVVMIATPHNLLAEIATAAAAAGKHILLEKPGARHVDELLALRTVVERQQVLLHVGFNHRYHRAFRKARGIVDSGALGPLMFLRARYGHGGRIGYDQEWRARPDLSGGGELIDQGVHLIDLARWFLGDFVGVEGSAHTYFWNMPVDDNVFMQLRTATDNVAFLHASCTEWKNTFSFELYGRDGKLQIDGLGGSYGIERLSWYRMLPEMGPPETEIWEYPMADNSWDVEVAEFLDDVRQHRQPAANLADAIAAMAIVDKIYQGARR